MLTWPPVKNMRSDPRCLSWVQFLLQGRFFISFRDLLTQYFLTNFFAFSFVLYFNMEHHSMYKNHVFFKKYCVFAHFFVPSSTALHQRLLKLASFINFCSNIWAAKQYLKTIYAFLYVE